jgi:ABC-type glycerol-3-phosphate transport system substrate-binding protein
MFSTMRKLLFVFLLITALTACSGFFTTKGDKTPTTTILKSEVESEPQTEIQIGKITEEAAPPEENHTDQTAIPPTTIPDPEETVLTLWHGLGGDDGVVLREIIQGFQEEDSDIQVNLVYIPYDDLLEKYTSAVEAGEGPTLLLGGGEWGQRLYDLGAAANLKNLVSTKFESQVNPPALETVIYSDAIVGIPFTISGSLMYRNESILSERSESFDELVANAQAVSSTEILGAYLERGSLFAYPQLSACGGKLMYPNGYPAFNNQSGICWLELLKSFDDAGAVAFNSDDDLTKFKAGEVGIIIDGTWNLFELWETLGSSLVIDPWPRYQNGRLSGYVWSENLYVNPGINIGDWQAVRGFSKYMLSREAQLVLSQNGYIPAITTLDNADPIIAQSMAVLSQGTPYPVQSEIEIYFRPLFDAFEAVFTEGVGAEEALQTATDRIVDQFDDFNTNGGEL